MTAMTLSTFFILPLGAWLFQVVTVLVGRVIHHQIETGNPYPNSGRGRLQYLDKFFRYDAAKLGVESWMVSVAIILIATVDKHSLFHSNPPEVGGSALLGILLMGIGFVVGLLVTISLWLYLEDHRGSHWWQSAPSSGVDFDKLKWSLGVAVSCAVGVGGLILAANLA